MRIISHLVAVSKNNVIGVNNDLPWSLKDDLAHFKKYTLNKIIIMGRKTFESIGRPLPNRKNYVVSRTIKDIPGAYVFDNTNSAILSAEEENKTMGVENEIIIIGGGYLFNETAPLMNKLVITRVDCDIEGDIFYPDIDLSSWKLVKTEIFKSSGTALLDNAALTAVKRANLPVAPEGLIEDKYRFQIPIKMSRN